MLQGRLCDKVLPISCQAVPFAGEEEAIMTTLVFGGGGLPRFPPCQYIAPAHRALPSENMRLPAPWQDKGIDV